MDKKDIIISKILVNGIEGRATYYKLAIAVFDDRTDIVVSPKTSAIAVFLSFFNPEWLSGESSCVIRRKLTLIISDAETGAFVSSKRISVRIPAASMDAESSAWIPLKVASLHPDRRYNLIVTDTATGEQLGCREFYVYPDSVTGRPFENMFEAEEGGVSPISGGGLYSSLSLNHNDYAKVRFNLRYRFNERFDKMPDVEIRLYFPDGSLRRNFRALVCDDYDADLYHVETTFLVSGNNRGLVYAEALLNDTAFAGMVFSTEAGERRGALSGKNLHILDSYSPEAAIERFNGDTPSEEDEEMSEEDFDRFVDDFIRQEIGDAGEEDGDDEPDLIEDVDAEDDQMYAALDALVGLEDVKEKLATYESMMRFNQLRKEAGLAVIPAPLHAMFLGSPGTGKTTVAKMMGKMLHRLGLLSKGHVVVRERATLSGTHYGDHEDLTLKAINEASGGILFIDEAYQLFQHNDPKDPGHLVIETLLTALADEGKRDWMLILAGYTDEMLRLFDINPGLRSRIPESNIYTFADLSERELLEVADRWFFRNDYTLTPEARRLLAGRLNADYTGRDRSFGNARHVMNLIQTGILPAMATRVMASESHSANDLVEIRPDDIPLRSTPMRNTRRTVGFRA